MSTSLAVMLFFSCNVIAHEAHEILHLDNQLDNVTSDNSDETVALILRRADLHRRQLNWEAALSDYQRIASQDPDNLAMLLGITQLHIDQGDYMPAVYLSARAYRLNPANTVAGLQYARSLAGIGKVDKATIVFERAVQQIDKPRPEHYIELARMLLSDNSERDGKRRAIGILDAGSDALGHPVSLHSFAYDLELESGQPEAALRRIDKVLARNKLLLNWRLRRGEMLLETASPVQAREEVLCLIKQINELPAKRRGSRAVQLALQRSQELMARVNASPNNLSNKKYTPC